MTSEAAGPRRALDEVLRILRTRRISKRPTLLEWREEFARLAASWRLPPGIGTRTTLAHTVPAEWIEAPESRPSRNILFLHGGGYCFGSPATHRDLAARLAKAAGARVLSVDYRLAPEHPYPAAIDDARTAYGWLIDQGVASRQIALAGDSAGGGLAAALLLRLKHEGMPLPAAAALFSPWTDLTASGDSVTSKAAVDPLLHPLLLEMATRAYVRDADPRHPWISPLFGDLAGLPPLLIQVGGREILLDDACRFSERARAEGVSVEIEVWDEMVHAWHFFASMLHEGREAIQQAGDFLALRWQ